MHLNCTAQCSRQGGVRPASLHPPGWYLLLSEPALRDADSARVVLRVTGAPAVLVADPTQHQWHQWQAAVQASASPQPPASTTTNCCCHSMLAPPAVVRTLNAAATRVHQHLTSSLKNTCSEPELSPSTAPALVLQLTSLVLKIQSALSCGLQSARPQALLMPTRPAQTGPPLPQQQQQQQVTDHRCTMQGSNRHSTEPLLAHRNPQHTDRDQQHLLS